MDVSEDEGLDLVAYGAMAVLCICLAVTFMFVKFALTELSPLQTSLGRIYVAAIVLVPLGLLFARPFPFNRRFLVWSIFHSFAGFLLPFTFLTHGQQHLPTNTSGIYFAFMPLLILGISAVVLNIRITGRKVTGFVIGVIGLCVLAEPWNGGSGGMLWPHLAIAATVVCFALSAVGMRFTPGVHPFVLMGTASGLAGILALPIAVQIVPEQMPGSLALTGLIGVGLVSTAMAFSLRYFIVLRKGPVFLAPNAFLSSSITVLIGIAFLGEELTLAMLLAAPLIIIGLIVAQDGSGKMKAV